MYKDENEEILYLFAYYYTVNDISLASERLGYKSFSHARREYSEMLGVDPNKPRRLRDHIAPFVNKAQIEGYYQENRPRSLVKLTIEKYKGFTEKQLREKLLLFQKNGLKSIVYNDLSVYSNEEHEPKKEGVKSYRLINHYERRPELRVAAIKIHGSRCMACGFDFYEKYGEIGLGYIEVHHMKPLADFIEPELVDPEKDMVVLCSNCHRMVHRDKYKAISVDKLKEIIKKELGLNNLC